MGGIEVVVPMASFREGGSEGNKDKMWDEP